MDRFGWRHGLGVLTIGALLTCGGVAHAQLPKAPAHDVEPSSAAKHEFQLGVDMLQDPDGARYEEAYRQFLRAYALSPSWKILGNLGLSAFKLERFADGIDAYERYLKAAGRDLDPTERQQIERDLEFMKSSSASLELTFTNADGPLTVQDTRPRAVGGPIINSYDVGTVTSTTLRLMAGTHTLSVSSGAKHAVVELSLQSGDKGARTVDLSAAVAASATPAAPATPRAAGAGPTAPAESKSSGLRTVGVVVGGVGVLAVVGGVVTYFMGSSKKSDLEKRCPNNTCSYSSTAEQQGFNDDKSSLKTLGAATTGLLIGGGVLAAAGATLFVVGGPAKTEQLALSAGPTGSGFAFAARGSF
jgi:hypothetical protein